MGWARRTWARGLVTGGRGSHPSAVSCGGWWAELGVGLSLWPGPKTSGLGSRRRTSTSLTRPLPGPMNPSPRQQELAAAFKSDPAPARGLHGRRPGADGLPRAVPRPCSKHRNQLPWASSQPPGGSLCSGSDLCPPTLSDGSQEGLSPEPRAQDTLEELSGRLPPQEPVQREADAHSRAAQRRRPGQVAGRPAGPAEHAGAPQEPAGG